MGNPNSVRLAFQVGGKLRKFVGFDHNKSGTLVIPLEPGINLGPAYAHTPPDTAISSDFLIAKQHYTVHRSSKNPRMNDIHFSQISEGGRPFDLHHWTRAIKTTKRFAPVTSQLMSSLKHGRLTDDRKSDVVNLGAFDPLRFTPIYSLFIAHKHREFSRRRGDFKSFQRAIGDYRIVLLWCFLNIPSHVVGVGLHAPTKDPSSLSDPKSIELNGHLMDGFSEDNCIFFFRYMRDCLRDAMIHRLRQELPHLETSSPGWHIAARAGYFKRAREGTIEHNKIIRRARAFGAFGPAPKQPK
jgi:hypothetical protein